METKWTRTKIVVQTKVVKLDKEARPEISGEI